MAALALLASCTLPDDFQRTAPHGTTAAYIVTEYAEDGTALRDWQVQSYKQGHFPPRCTFTDPETGEAVTLRGTFSVEALEITKR